MMKNAILFVLATIVSAVSSRAQTDGLREGFIHPPPSARPWVYWMWMDGNLTREGITADLEAMKRAGIGGAIVMEVNVGIPRGPVAFMSREWQQLFTHVVREAERLGLEITLNAGPGWTGSGGPWVKPEQSMQHIVAADTALHGPGRFEGVLPQPARRPAFFGDGKLPPALEKAKDDFYRDVAVLAFPTPKDTQRIPDIDEKALFTRAPYSSQPGVKPFLQESPDTVPASGKRGIATSTVINLTGKLTGNGYLSWDIPEGDWTVMRFGRTSTGANTRPAPVPGVGLECDKLDRAALASHFDAFIGTLLRDVGTRRSPAKAGWTMLHIDSWEMGAQNWTERFRDEFRIRRGYDVLPYLPATTGRVVESLQHSERFLWDLRQTAQELLLENHALYLRELAHRNGFGLSIEPYDMTPCADMSLGSLADVPMCEFWLYGFNTTYSVVEATSIAHTTGHPVVAAEAFTSTDAEAWQAYPGSMKELGDWAFSAGVNRFVFHRYQHQPWLDRRPGMTMGPYGVHWERTQTWWDMSSAYHEYLGRCQFMLRWGLPVADVCYLVAEGAPQVFRPPFSALQGNPPGRPGYNFDGCAPEVLLQRMSVRNGKLVLPDGMTYSVLVLPERETMTPVLLRKIRDLAKAGATVIGPRPRRSPSLSGYPDCDRDVERISQELWGDCDGRTVTEHGIGKGRVIWRRDPAQVSSLEEEGGTAEPLRGRQYGDYSVVAGVLKASGILPDFESDAGLRYTHRRQSGTDIYFVANPQGKRITATCKFRVSGKSPELWDPVSLERRNLPQFAFARGRTVLSIGFEPYQSFFFVFRQPAPRIHPQGENSTERVPASELTGPWEVSFDRMWGGPGTVTFEELQDWSKRSENGIRFYSGTAVYRTTFDLPPLAPAARHGTKPPERVWLDLGSVHNLARVSLNGQRLGTLWCAPWHLEITQLLKPAGNRLEIAVANLWPNRLIGDEQLPADCEFGRNGNLEGWPEWLLKGEERPSAGRYTFTTWKHYSANSPLLPSGLLGPVLLLRASDHKTP